MVADGDLEELPTGPTDVIVLAIAGDAVAGALNAGKLLNMKVG